MNTETVLQKKNARKINANSIYDHLHLMQMRSLRRTGGVSLADQLLK